MSQAFLKVRYHQNLTTKRFNLLQEKVVIQAVCLRTQAVSIKSPGLGRGFWYLGKVTSKLQQSQTNYF